MARKMSAAIAMPMPEQTEQEIFDQRLESAKSDYSRKSRRVDQKILQHDAAGFETEMMEFSEYDDGYGNNVAHGDLSVQKIVEGGGRNLSTYPQPFDTDPFMSRRQQGYMHAAADRGEIAQSVVKEFDKSTDFSKLPERASKKKKLY